jgi:selenocysteine-specific translation elongation factor
VAEAPTSLAINLANLSLDAVHRGDVLTDDESVRATRIIDVALRSPTPCSGAARPSRSTSAPPTPARG